jgi:hypothetical protein
MSKVIKLTKGQIAIVDDEDYDFLSQWKWHFNQDRYGGYATKMIKKGKKRLALKMHRLIMAVSNNMQIDHINGNKLDNRKINLRICNVQENMRNRGNQKNNTSGYKGVNFFKNKWRSYIYVNKKQIFLGYFKELSDAVHAYNDASLKYFGDFSKLNQL